ncbi:pentatricopeptide repeat-containing protein At2g20710, mitochondrial-like [Arachis stenosperma]|uniref:pentatricopeptide repeat-containing protein At2g20710, mitochondrial-like n=1 Tax=Arachis stenosperma TaxID=217475 RepID=UPI0025AC025E|nr:pentatricopeptide repeat-containing protein At2g20710, mitochondrial-like [Arachis stenosperma]
MAELLTITDSYLLSGNSDRAEDIETPSRVEEFVGAKLYWLQDKRQSEPYFMVSSWMFEKGSSKHKSGDLAIRLDLIGKVNGLEEAEFYFNSIPKYLRTGECYSSLLNCNARARDVDRAESIMEKMRALGFAMSIFSRNVLLNLYYQTQNYDKLENLGIDKLLAQLEHNRIWYWHLDWTVYAIAANCYRKQGLFEKAFNVLKNSERLITNKKRRVALTFLMTRYAAMIKKEVMRLWKLLTTDGKLYSIAYLAVIASVLKFEDFESAENIFKIWESKNLGFDIRIPNVMIGAYSKKGNMETAESVVDWTIINNGEPNSKTWSYLSSGYIEQGKGDMEGAEELVRLLRSKDLVSLDVHKKLMNWIKDVESNVHAIDVLCGDSHKQTNGVSEAKGRQEQQ